MPEPRPSNAEQDRGLMSELAQRAGAQSKVGSETYETRAVRIAEWRARLLGAVRLQERLALLFEFGLTDAEIARAIPEGKARSVRRWRVEGVARGRLAGRWAPIDDLCAIVGFLLSDGTYDEEAIVAWLRSRRPELEHARPLDVLGAGGFSDVYTAAETMLAAVPSDGGEGPLSRPQVIAMEPGNAAGAVTRVQPLPNSRNGPPASRLSGRARK